MPQLLSPLSTACKPQLLKLTWPRAHAPQEEKPLQSLPSTAREQPPCLLLLENLCRATKNLCTVMKTQCSQNKTKQSNPTHQPTKKKKNKKISGICSKRQKGKDWQSHFHISNYRLVSCPVKTCERDRGEELYWGSSTSQY